MLIPLVIACYFRLRIGLKGEGEKTLHEELFAFGVTTFVCYVIWAIIEFLI
jgi:hypothetical protein